MVRRRPIFKLSSPGFGLHGFTVNSVLPSGMAIDFSGTARAVRAAFQTEIHSLYVNGVRHIANVGDPSIPEALAPAVAGIVSLHDFKPHPKRRSRSDYTITSGNGTLQAVTPGDLATIYNIAPLFAAGYTGRGQTIALIEDTDLYSTSDWTTFRSAFGLATLYLPALSTIHPAPANGDSAVPIRASSAGDAEEAILDAEWASAAAPGAAIKIVSCASTRTTFGGLIALQNLVNGPSPPSIISLSYGECETQNGASANAAFAAVFQQAAAEGISVFVTPATKAQRVATPRPGRDARDRVSGFASTPYNVAVGGTDFGDTQAGTTGSYWNKTNTATYASARSYIPEIPWNDSCASQLLASYFGFSTTYGPNGFCASTTALVDGILDVVAGSGGPSGCATGTPSASGIVGGTCRLSEAVLASRQRHPRRRRPRHPGPVAVCRRRPVGALLRRLLLEPARRRRSLHGSAQPVERRRRHLLRVADHGRHPGAGGPKGRRRPGQSQLCLLQTGRDVRQCLQCLGNDRQRLHLPQRHQRRHRRRLQRQRRLCRGDDDGKVAPGRLCRPVRGRYRGSVPLQPDLPAGLCRGLRLEFRNRFGQRRRL